MPSLISHPCVKIKGAGLMFKTCLQLARISSCHITVLPVMKGGLCVHGNNNNNRRLVTLAEHTSDGTTVP